jgi:hypothetical protein
MDYFYIVLDAQLNELLLPPFIKKPEVKRRIITSKISGRMIGYSMNLNAVYLFVERLVPIVPAQQMNPEPFFQKGSRLLFDPDVRGKRVV